MKRDKIYPEWSVLQKKSQHWYYCCYCVTPGPNYHRARLRLQIFFAYWDGRLNFDAWLVWLSWLTECKKKHEL